ncbi:MAG: hypothetical protein AAF968_20940 [Pseudomonadota bacterium]
MKWLGKMAGKKPALLDESYLERLRQHLGEDMVAELLADGELELTDRAAQLRRMVAEGDVEGVRRLSHDLIAVAGHLGLSALSLAAVDLNRRLRSAQPSDLGAATERTLPLADRSLAAIAAWRDTAARNEAGG